MANDDRGTKRTDPETGKKFYDLNKDPIVSPYTGKSYPLSYFQEVAATKPARVAPVAEEDEVEVEDAAEEAGAEIVSLEDADADTPDADEDIPDVEDVEDVEDLGDDDDTFLEEEDEDEDLDFDVGGGDEER